MRYFLTHWGFLIAVFAAGASAIVVASLQPSGSRLVRFWDMLCLLLMFLLPPVFVLRWNLAGAIAGAAIFWGIGVLAGKIAQALSPHRDAAMLDSMWLLFGIAGGLVYCVPIYLLKLSVKLMIRSCAARRVTAMRVALTSR